MHNGPGEHIYSFLCQAGRAPVNNITSSDMTLEMKKLLTERNNENLRDSFTLT